MAKASAARKKKATKPTLYELTPEHRAQLDPWHQKWVRVPMQTGPYTDEDRATAVTVMRGLYKAAKLKPPPREVFAPSPICGAFAAGIASGVWWLRENPKRHKTLFGHVLSEGEIQTAMHRACAVADGQVPPKAVILDDATRDATRDATSDATRDATSDATLDATSAATSAATLDATSAATRAVTSFLLGCTTRWYNLYNGGNQWSGWAEYLSFFRHVAKLKLDYSKWKHYEAAARVGPRFMHKHFWIVCSRPDVLRVDDQNRPHCATGPSHRWPDGRELFYWRGQRIPGEWITDAKNVDPMLVLTHPNVEQRRCLAEIVGWTRALERLNPVVVDKHPNPEVGELLRLDPMPGTNEDPIGQFLKVRCGTGRTFVLRVSPRCTTALEAQAELWQVPSEQYARLEVRT